MTFFIYLNEKTSIIWGGGWFLCRHLRFKSQQNVQEMLGKICRASSRINIIEKIKQQVTQ